MKTLVIISHPDYEHSRAVRALAQVAEADSACVVRHLESLYGDDASAIDVAAEQVAYDDADRIVFMFPIHWFNLTPMLKSYLNRVWTYGWAFGPGGTALRGKSMQAVVTAGASAHTYSHDGLIASTMAEVLTPLKASALYVGMRYLPPVTFYDVMGADDKKLFKMKTEFRQHLSSSASRQTELAALA